MTRKRPTYPSVRELIDLYLRMDAGNQASDTLAGRRALLMDFAGDHGDKPWNGVTKLDLAMWIQAHEGWRSDWTVKRAYSTVGRVFSWACKLDLIPANPFAGLSHRPGSRGRPLTDGEFRAMLRASDATFRRVLFFLFWTGARPCEMSALQWSNVDLDGGIAILERHKTARSTGMPRAIILVDQCVRMLRYIKRHQSADTIHVFLNYRRSPWTRVSLGLRLYRLRAKAKLPMDARLYSLRHRMGTACILAGVDLKTTAELMGHSSTRMTEHYLHLAGQRDHLKQALAKVFNKNGKGK